MGEISIFESRTGKAACSDNNFYSFITDIRNFREIIPGSTASNIVIEKESCSFSINMLGTVKMRIAEKIPYDKVVFSGNALQVNDFQLIVKILKSDGFTTDMQIVLSAELNPLLKMIAAEPVKRLLEAFIDEIEKFGRWNDIKEYSQSL